MVTSATSPKVTRAPLAVMRGMSRTAAAEVMSPDRLTVESRLPWVTEPAGTVKSMAAIYWAMVDMVRPY